MTYMVGCAHCGFFTNAETYRDLISHLTEEHKVGYLNAVSYAFRQYQDAHDREYVDRFAAKGSN